MSIQRNWWDLTGCGSRFREDVIAALGSSRSVALVGSDIPWIDVFHEKLKGANISASKAFETICGADITRPAEYLFGRYCTTEIQSNYWPNPPAYTHVNFLAENNDVIINHRFVVVRGFASEKSFFCWCDFVEKYSKCVRSAGIDPDDRAVFILEYGGGRSAASRLDAVQVIPFEPKDVDIFTYNLVNTVDDYNVYLLNRYAAELISELCGNDVELCGFLSEYDGLAEHPAATYRSFARDNSVSECLSSEQINSAVLLAQFKVFFPLIEQKRRELIARYYEAIRLCLPWKNDYNEDKIEPYDMELRDLIFKFGAIGVSEADRNTIKILRDARNQLAHNHALTYEDIMGFVTVSRN